MYACSSFINIIVTHNHNRQSPSLMQVIFQCTHWLRSWALLQQEVDRPLVMAACTQVERALKEVFTHNEWQRKLQPQAP